MPRDPERGPGPIARLVTACSNRAWPVVLLVVVLGLTSVAYTRQHFAMTTDTMALISPDLPWRRLKADFEKTFPQENDLIVAVIDGATPELAESGAAALAAKLSPRSDLFRSVRRPDGIPFFSHEGLLFQPLDELKDTTGQLIAAQPFLGPLAADPSLRGVMDSLATALLGVEHGDTTLDKLQAPLSAMAEALGRLAAGERAFFSWRTLISGGKPSLRETRRFVLFQPILDNALLIPGGAATDAIHAAALGLDLDPAHGVTVRLTGSVVLADDEFASLEQRVGLMVAVMATGVLAMLWLAVRSFRLIAAILATTLTGLALTAAIGLLAVGRFNLISVAFIPLFVGLGIDFAIQFSVRYRAERVTHPDLRNALAATGDAIGGSLALAAAATAIGFFAFLPTDYMGASELGLIAGIGMVTAFLLSITFLPALLTLARLPGEVEAIGFASLAPVDRFLADRRKYVLGIAAATAIVSIALLPLLRFDFNPLHLRDPRVESMATLLDLAADPDHTPNTLDALAPSAGAAAKLAARLAALPEVSRAVTLASFIPDDQPEKLALIRDAASLLEFTVDPIDKKPPPSDAENVAALTATATSLRKAAGTDATPAAEDARRLASTLERLAVGSPALRSRASALLIDPLEVMLGQLRAALQAKPVTRASLPPGLVRDWVAPDGRVRVQAAMRGSGDDNEALARFARAVQAVAPDAVGAPIFIQEAARMIVRAFIEAGIWSFVAITVLLALVLRRIRDVILTLAPILLTGLLTLDTCVLTGDALNFANIIALPLLFGIGVAFNIYFVIAWRSGGTRLLESSLARAVLFSALTTSSAFGNLWLSAHPGTAGMGRLLLISLGWTLIVALLFEPVLLGSPPVRR